MRGCCSVTLNCLGLLEILVTAPYMRGKALVQPEGSQVSRFLHLKAQPAAGHVGQGVIKVARLAGSRGTEC